MQLLLRLDAVQLWLLRPGCGCFGPLSHNTPRPCAPIRNAPCGTLPARISLCDRCNERITCASHGTSARQALVNRAELAVAGNAAYKELLCQYFAIVHGVPPIASPQLRAPAERLTTMHETPSEDKQPLWPVSSAPCEKGQALLPGL